MIQAHVPCIHAELKSVYLFTIGQSVTAILFFMTYMGIHIHRCIHIHEVYGQLPNMSDNGNFHCDDLDFKRKCTCFCFAHMVWCTCFELHFGISKVCIHRFIHIYEVYEQLPNMSVNGNFHCHDLMKVHMFCARGWCARFQLHLYMYYAHCPKCLYNEAYICTRICFPKTINLREQKVL